MLSRHNDCKTDSILPTACGAMLILLSQAGIIVAYLTIIFKVLSHSRKLRSLYLIVYTNVHFGTYYLFTKYIVLYKRIDYLFPNNSLILVCAFLHSPNGQPSIKTHLYFRSGICQLRSL